MPQMSPIMWLLLFVIFSMTFMIFNIVNYYLFMPFMPKSNLLKKNNLTNSLNWKW